MQFLTAESLQQACELLADDPSGSKVVAGGTAVVLMLKHRLISPDRLISIDRLPDLSDITIDADVVRIGGTARIAAAARHPEVRAILPALAHAAGLVGNVRIRNAGTMGGNVAEADYASDPPAVLISMGARAVIRGPQGERRADVDDVITGFYSTSLEPGEVITAIEVPRRDGQRSVYEKYRSRSSEDRPCVGVAATGTFRADGSVDALAVVVGAAGPRPQRLPDVTTAAVGGMLDTTTIAEIAERYGTDLELMDDQRGSAWYRGRAVRVMVRRALTQLVEPMEAAA